MKFKYIFVINFVIYMLKMAICHSYSSFMILLFNLYRKFIEIHDSIY